MKAKRIVNIRNKMQTRSVFSFWTHQFLILLIIHLCFAFAVMCVFYTSNFQDSETLSITAEYYVIVIRFLFGAMLETLVFQVFLYFFFENVCLRFPPVKYVVISSLLFGMAHFTGFDFDGLITVEILRIITMCFAGAVYAVTFYILKKKHKNAFLLVSLMHFTYNCCIVGITYLFGYLIDALM